ncbi:MAG: hypothetical protein ACP6IY_20530, partial [Promethearchaeia archaeon]
ANVSFYVDNEFKLRTEANRYSFSTINKFAFNTDITQISGYIYFKMLSFSELDNLYGDGYINNQFWEYDNRYNNYNDNFEQANYSISTVTDYNSTIGFFNHSGMNIEYRFPTWKRWNWLDNSRLPGQFFWNKSEYQIYDHFFTDTSSDYTLTRCNMIYEDNSIMRVDATTSDPYFYLATNPFNVSGSFFRYIVIKYKFLNGTFDYGQIFYKTNSHGISASYYKNISLNFDKNWHITYIDMYDLDNGGNDWKNSYITNIRFDLSDLSDMSIEIDFLGLVHEKPTNTIDSSIIINLTENSEFNWVFRNSEEISAWLTLADNQFSITTKNGYSYTTQTTSVSYNYSYPVYLRMVLNPIDESVTGYISSLNGYSLTSISADYFLMLNNPFYTTIFEDIGNDDNQNSSIIGLNSNYQFNNNPLNQNWILKNFTSIPDSNYNHENLLNIYNCYYNSYSQFDYENRIPMDIAFTNDITHSLVRKPMSYYRNSTNYYPIYTNVYEITANSTEESYALFKYDNGITDELNWAYGGIFSIDNLSSYLTIQFNFGNRYFKIQKFPSYVEDIWFSSNISSSYYQEIKSSSAYDINYDFWVFLYAEDNSSIHINYGIGSLYYSDTLTWRNFTGITPEVYVYGGMSTGGGFINTNNVPINIFMIYNDTADNYLAEEIHGKINPINPKLEYKPSLKTYTIFDKPSLSVNNYYNRIYSIKSSFSYTNRESVTTWETYFEFSNASVHILASNYIWYGSDIFNYTQYDNYWVNISQSYNLYNYQGIEYKTDITYEITWVFYYQTIEPDIFDIGIQMLVPIAIFIIFPYVFAQRWGKKGAVIGFIFGGVMLGITQLVSLPMSIIISIISLVIAYIIFKKGGDSLE